MKYEYSYTCSNNFIFFSKGFESLQRKGSGAALSPSVAQLVSVSFMSCDSGTLALRLLHVGATDLRSPAKSVLTHG